MRLIVFVLPLLVFSCCGNPKKAKHEKHVSMITVKFVDFDIETPIDIKCADFEKYFSNIQIKVIEDSMKINQIINTLLVLKTAGNDYYPHVDTRVKLEIKYSNDSIETICMDRFILSRNNRVFINSDSLKILLTEKELIH